MMQGQRVTCHSLTGRLVLLRIKTRMSFGGMPMKTKKSEALLNEQDLSPEPESMQKYSNDLRERIAKKAYELYEQRGRQPERHVEDWLKAEEIIRKEMNDNRS